MAVSVLVIGGGGRESALCYGLSVSDNVSRVYCSPGNAGTALLPKSENTVLADSEIIDFAKKETIDLVVIGPDAPVVDGLADRLRAAGIVTFGPSAQAARLEGSKAFATEFMQAEQVPLPPSKICHSIQEALRAIDNFGGSAAAVIKADGLAAGKGVYLVDTVQESTAALEQIFAGKVDGQGNTVVIQQRYHGPEVSIFVLSDGNGNSRLIPIASQDHKRLLEGDTGPNTGGMGVYAPLPDWMVNKKQWATIQTIVDKTLVGMKRRGTPYQGVLYLGLMLAEELNDSPAVIEYNARFGDPETEVLIPLLLANGVDIYKMLHAAASSLDDFSLPSTLAKSAVTICLAANGYPANPQVGELIKGLDDLPPGILTFHGGTKALGRTIITDGGRVLYITAVANDLATALTAANQAIGDNGIHFKGMQYRRDIGHRAINTDQK